MASKTQKKGSGTEQPQDPKVEELVPPIVANEPPVEDGLAAPEDAPSGAPVPDEPTQPDEPAEAFDDDEMVNDALGIKLLESECIRESIAELLKDINADYGMPLGDAVRNYAIASLQPVYDALLEVAVRHEDLGPTDSSRTPFALGDRQLSIAEVATLLGDEGHPAAAELLVNAVDRAGATKVARALIFGFIAAQVAALELGAQQLQDAGR